METAQWEAMGSERAGYEQTATDEVIQLWEAAKR